MNGKAIVAVAALLLYLLILSGFVLVKQEELEAVAGQIQRMSAAEQDLRELRISTFHTLLALQENKSALEDRQGGGLVPAGFDFHLLQSAYRSFMARGEGGDRLALVLQDRLAQASSSLAAGNARAFSQHLKMLVQEVEVGGTELRQDIQILEQTYRQKSDSLTGVALGMGVLGVILFGSTVGIFFSRLAGDLNLLKAKAQEIVKGRRGRPLDIQRRDEVGQLMEAVNQMQLELARQEEELALERQRAMHREKMVAIGTLAAGIAHEIGNPITAISGIAQQMCSEQGQRHCRDQGAQCFPEMILEQTQRVARITREVSAFSSQRSHMRELLDLNQLVRSTASLMRFDKRYRDIELLLDLDSQLPAIQGVADQLIQVLMNLMINAADAMEDVHDRPHQIRVATRANEGGVEVVVADNGKGMDADTLHRATEAFFTTKPVGKGTGLGLSLCSSVVEECRGQLRIESTPGQGTTVRVMLPLAHGHNLHP